MHHPPCRQPFAARHTLLRLAVLPAALVAAIAIAVVVCVLLLLGGAAVRQDEPEPGGEALWGVLVVAALLTGAVVTGAAVAAAAEAGTRADRIAALCRQAARGRIELQALLRKLELGERATPLRLPRQERQAPEAPEETREAAGDALAQLRHEIAALRRAAEATVAEAIALPGRDQVARDERIGLFVSLARRMQGSVHRQIECVEELQNEVEDPELLKGLCQVDHQATRIRRHAENLAVLGGSVARRPWSRPVRMSELLRACVAESEHYARVRILPPAVEGSLRGQAVADVVHLLVELIQNAAEFSAPQTQVLLRMRGTAAGLVVEVEDRGIGMTASERERLNAVLACDPRAHADELLDDGHAGLFVVASLARRHGVAVQLQSNVYGGVQAVVVLPQELLAEEAEERRHQPWRSLAAAGAALPGGGGGGDGARDQQDLVPRQGGAPDDR
ncbi:sensor histidine kinase [Streptomyces sp. 6N223]|uniref:sensor histidine kinase n=1 Tax=Streptomyces sp. 6N223 TaxID=3457412 RepID=UPI003FD3E5C3